MHTKKLILSLFLFFCVYQNINAQTNTGNILVGGTLGWTNHDHEEVNLIDYNRKEFRGNLMGGYFVKDNLALGLTINVINFKEHTINNNADNSWKSTTLIAGPFIRKYFPLNKNFAFYGQAMVGYGIVKGSNEYTFSNDYHSKFDYTGRLLNAAIKPGVAYFFTNKLGIDLTVQGLQYNFEKTKNVKSTHKDFTADFNLRSLNFGVNFYLSK